MRVDTHNFVCFSTTKTKVICMTFRKLSQERGRMVSMTKKHESIKLTPSFTLLSSLLWPLLPAIVALFVRGLAQMSISWDMLYSAEISLVVGIYLVLCMKDSIGLEKRNKVLSEHAWVMYMFCLAIFILIFGFSTFADTRVNHSGSSGSPHYEEMISFLRIATLIFSPVVVAFSEIVRKKTYGGVR